MMTEETPNQNPLRTPLTTEEKKQIRTLVIFLGFIIMAIFTISLVIGVVSNSLWSAG